MDMPASVELFGDAEPPIVEPVERRLHRLAHRAFAGGTDALPRLPAGIDGGGEVLAHDGHTSEGERTMRQPSQPVNVDGLARRNRP